MKLTRLISILLMLALVVASISACAGPCTEHKDEDKDDVCDVCKEAVMLHPCDTCQDGDDADIKCDRCGKDVPCTK